MVVSFKGQFATAQNKSTGKSQANNLLYQISLGRIALIDNLWRKTQSIVGGTIFCFGVLNYEGEKLTM